MRFDAKHGAEGSRTTARYSCLENRAVVISGGAIGIGSALVRAFALQGARVGFVDLDQDRGTALAEQLSHEGKSVLFTTCDVTDTGAYRMAIREFAAKNGTCRALLNNAANDTRQDWQQLSEKSFHQGISVNLGHSLFAAQAVAPGMIEAGGGAIINFGSVAWMMAAGSLPVYSAAKAAQHGLTRTLARDLGKHNIRVNTLVPGWVMTERQLDLWVDDEAEALIDRSQCMAGRVQPEDIADMAMFLASDQARMCSAQNFIVDGGWV